jgi:hypothetical protein
MPPAELPDQENPGKQCSMARPLKALSTAGRHLSTFKGTGTSIIFSELFKRSGGKLGVVLGRSTDLALRPTSGLKGSLQVVN